jgi:hypothetical protein
MFVLCWYLLVKVIALVTVEFPNEVFVSDVRFFGSSVKCIDKTWNKAV